MDYSETQVVEVASGSIKLNFKGLKSDPITKELLKTGTFYELPALENMRRFVEGIMSSEGVDWGVDAGANIGNHSLYMGSFLPKLNIFSYEMNPITFNLLSENVSMSHLNNIQIYNSGLSDTVRRCGVLENAGNPLGGAQLDLGDESGHINLTTLDSEMANLPKEGRCVFLKLDVEGHELEVLKGATSLLEKHRPLIFAELKELFEFKEIDKLLTSFGYNVMYAESDQIPNFMFCHKSHAEQLFSLEERQQIRRDLCLRVVESWQLRRKIYHLQAENIELKSSQK